MAVRKLDLYDLLGPQFLLGFTFPEHIDRNLSVLTVDELHTTYDRDLILYSGVLKVGGDGEGGLDFVQDMPQGGSFQWNGNRFSFRLTLSREASAANNTTITTGINAAINPNPAAPPAADSMLDRLLDLFQDFRPAGEAAADPIAHPHDGILRDETTTDYPGLGFKLELMLDLLNFSLGSQWKAGRLDAASHQLVRDDDPRYAGQRVKIMLPKAVLRYQQSADLGRNPEFAVDSWGGAGLDTPNDLRVGEFIRMEPQIAIHESGDIGFSVDQIILDASPDTTPPEILQHFGTSEDWQGIYFGLLLFYYRNKQGVGVNFRVSDGLISFAGEVSLEGAVDFFLKKDLTSLSVTSRIFTGPKEIDFKHGVVKRPDDMPPAIPLGRATVEKGSVLQLEVSGGTPGYSIRVTRNGSSNYPDNSSIYDQAKRQVLFSEVGVDQDYLIEVEDSKTPDSRKFVEYIRVKVVAALNPAPAGGVGTPADRALDARHLSAVMTGQVGATPAIGMLHQAATSGTVETLRLSGQQPATITINRGTDPALTATLTAARRTYSFEVPYGANYGITVDVDGSAQKTLPPKDITFTIDQPLAVHQPSYLRDAGNMGIGTDATGRPIITVPQGDGDSGDGTFLNNVVGLSDYLLPVNKIASVRVDGFASHLTFTNHDRELATNRHRVGEAIATELNIPLDPAGNGNGPYANSDGSPVSPGTEPRTFQTARFEVTLKPVAPFQLTANIARPVRPTLPQTEIPVATPKPTPAAPPLPDKMPSVLRRMGLRVRLERNALVLLELNGEIDFETAMEEKIRTQKTDLPTDQSVGLKNAGGNDNPEDGVVDFRAIYTYNTATSEYGVNLILGSHPEDTDGLLHMDNPTGPDRSVLKDIFGALLLFAPIINGAAVSVAENSDDAGGWIGLGASVAVPITVGGLGIIRTRRVVLYGGEVMTRFSQPGAAGPGSLDLGLTFDYGVEFDIVVDSLGIGKERKIKNATVAPLKARYKAIGFIIHHDDVAGEREVTYQPVFDSSRGYDLELTDPSLFSLSEPLGNLFSVAAARLARFNPLTLEVDMALKVDLGVITVDKFKIKIPVDGKGGVQILPSGIKVNIPGTLVGNGFVNIVDKEGLDSMGSTITYKGIEGGLDLTLVPMKLRIAAAVAVSSLKDDANDREGVGVFASLVVEFPSPIVLGVSGLGLYGVMGLFAMHYRRVESETILPTDPVGPALQWLVRAEGDPTKLYDKNKKALWAPEFDRWSFGVGVILGTMDTGFTANFQGMFVLELPGPRILIMVKMKFIAIKPAAVDDVKDGNGDSTITTGIIAVIDLDFERETLTIGVIIDFEIEEILKLTVPIEIFFNLASLADWHLYLGTRGVPVAASILNMVRGSAYFMIAGHDIPAPGSLPYLPSSAPILSQKLTGVAMALGLEASLFFGSRSAGLYLEIGAGFHVGLSFAPFVMVGSMYFRGELRLFVASIGASGNLDVLITRRGKDSYHYLHGKVCGKIKLLFFKISACIEITIEGGTKGIEAPALFNGVYLQSYAPVLTSGQGGDRPIDASLGNAVEGITTVDLPVVPIDSVIVLQLYASPQTGGVSAPFAEQIVTSPDARPGGWIKLSNETRIKYDLKEILLTEDNGSTYRDPNGGIDKVPVTWRLDRNSSDNLTNGAKMNIDLALFSRVPTTADRALERSTELRQRVEVQWGDVCKKPAPAAPVLFTFCDELLGTSSTGWHLHGIAKPDPAGTLRIDPPNTKLRVTEPGALASGAWETIMADLDQPHVIPARVVGLTAVGKGWKPDTASDRPDPNKATCVDFSKRERRVFDLFDRGVFLASGRKISVLKKNIFVTKASLARAGASVNDLLRRPLRADLSSSNLRKVPAVLNAAFRGKRKNIELAEAKIGIVNGHQGILFDKYVAVQFRKPVCRIEVTFRASGPERTVTLRALNAKRKEVARTQVQLTEGGVAFSPQMMSITGEDIVTVIVAAPKVKGVISRICYYTDCQEKAVEKDTCYRALQLPYQGATTEGVLERYFNDDREISDAARKFGQQNEVDRRIDLGTDGIAYLRCYAAIYPKFMGFVRVEEIDAAGEVVARHRLNDLAVKEIATTADLPADWTNPALPWRDEVGMLSNFLFSDYFAEYTKYTFVLKPLEGERCVTVRIVVDVPTPDFPAFYLGAVERLQLSELEQQGTIRDSLRGSLDTLDGYLNQADNTRLLMKPDTVYHLTANYTTSIDTSGSSLVTRNKSQAYSFRTDAAPPPELKAYILGSTPDMDEGYHFFEDPLKVVFNDQSTLDMYAAYGKKLMGSIRRADGAPMIESPDNVTITPMAATVLTPYREMVEAMIAEGKLPCAGGGFSKETHGVYVAPFALKPLMAYTFDVELDPADLVAAGAARTPLFRRAFRTSRYANVVDFADSVAKLPVYDMALETLLSVPVSAVPSAARPEVVTVADVEMETMLTAVGLPAMAGAERTGVWTLRTQSGGSFRPHAILIDAAEPLWRERTEAVRVPVTDAGNAVADPSFVIYEPGKVSALEVVEPGSDLVHTFVRSAAGTRCLLILHPNVTAAGVVTLTIDLLQMGSLLYDLPKQSSPLLEINLEPKAPWEE